MLIGIIPANPLVKFCREFSKYKFIFHFSFLLILTFANLRQRKENCEYLIRMI